MRRHEAAPQNSRPLTLTELGFSASSAAASGRSSADFAWAYANDTPILFQIRQPQGTFERVIALSEGTLARSLRIAALANGHYMLLWLEFTGSLSLGGSLHFLRSDADGFGSSAYPLSLLPSCDARMRTPRFVSTDAYQLLEFDAAASSTPQSRASTL